MHLAQELTGLIFSSVLGNPGVVTVFGEDLNSLRKLICPDGIATRGVMPLLDLTITVGSRAALHASASLLRSQILVLKM